MNKRYDSARTRSDSDNEQRNGVKIYSEQSSDDNIIVTCAATPSPHQFHKHASYYESDVDDIARNVTQLPPSFPRRDRINSDASMNISDEEIARLALPPRFPPRNRIYSSDNGYSSDDVSYGTPKHQVNHNRNLLQPSPCGVMDFDEEYSTTDSCRPPRSFISSCSEGSDDIFEEHLVPTTPFADTPLPSLKRNLMTCHQKHRELTECYEVLEILGEGSMGSVCRVKKRPEAMGGSARPSFVKHQKEMKRWKFLQSCFFFCPFANENSQSYSKDLFEFVPDDELTTAEHNFVDNRREGFNCTPCKGTMDGHKNVEYALKTINLNRGSSSDFRRELENEVKMLKDLDHPNIVRAIETFNNQNQLFLVLELCNGGDLYSRDPYSEQDAMKIVTDVFGAVAYMHSRNIIHRDIKFENIVFTGDEQNAGVKLVDFGLSKECATGCYLHETVGTIYSMAPEVFRGSYSSKVDIWSMGIVAYMLLSSTMPFFGKDRNRIMRKIMKGKIRFANHRWKFISKDAKRFISLLLQRDPERRPTAEQAINHPWLVSDLVQKDSISNLMDSVQTAIHSFAYYGILKRLALMIVAYRSTNEEIGFLRQIFNKFDILKDGEISLPTFKKVLGDYLYSDEELKMLFTAMDIDGNGKVYYTEFLAATIEARGSINEERLAEAFDCMDCDDSGDITIEDLKKMLGKGINATFFEAVIGAVDLNHDQKISYDEFLAMWDNTADASSYIQVKRQKIRRMNSKQSLNSLTLETVTSSVSYLTDDEVIRNIHLMTQKTTNEAQHPCTKPNLFPDPASIPLDSAQRPTFSKRSKFNAQPKYPNKTPLTKFNQRKHPNSNICQLSNNRSGPTNLQPHSPTLIYHHNQYLHLQQNQMMQHSGFLHHQQLVSVHMGYQPHYQRQPIAHLNHGHANQLYCVPNTNWLEPATIQATQRNQQFGQ